MKKNILTVKNLSKDFVDQFGFTIHLFEDLDLSVEEDPITTLLAPKGTGKTSLLKIIAGLETQSGGEIEPGNNHCIFIPSQPSSFPWLNVKENVIFNLDNVSPTLISDTINFVGLQGYEEHFPNNKSVGFRFRISFARALIRNPKIIVIDEPFNNLGIDSRNEIYILLRKAAEDSPVSILFATTNITESIFLSDKIYLLQSNPGKIIDEFIVNLPQKRNLDLLKDNEFINLRNEVNKKIESMNSNQLFKFYV